MSAADGKDKEVQFEEQQDGSVVVTDPDFAQSDDTTNVTGEGVHGDKPATEDERVRTGGDEDDDAPAGISEAAELKGAKTDEEREAIRERRRQERQDAKQRRKDAEERLRGEIRARDSLINQLTTRLDKLERRTSGADLAQLDHKLGQEQQSVEYLKGVIAEATKTQNGEVVADATVRLQQAIVNVDHLRRVRQSFAQQQQNPQQPHIDPRMVNHAATWMQENAWYKPHENDPDSNMVRAIDAQLAQEGFDPNSPTYWQELTNRAQRYIPALRGQNGGQGAPQGGKAGYNPAADQRKPARSVVTGSGREGAAQGGAGSGFVLSAERVQALKDAGMWDDPKLRNEAIRRARDYDAQAARGSR